SRSGQRFGWHQAVYTRGCRRLSLPVCLPAYSQTGKGVRILSNVQKSPCRWRPCLPRIFLVCRPCPQFPTAQRRLLALWKFKLHHYQLKRIPPLIAISSYHFSELALAPLIATSGTATNPFGGSMAINSVWTRDGSDESLRFQPMERLKVYLFGATVLFASFGM